MASPSHAWLFGASACWGPAAASADKWSNCTAVWMARSPPPSRASAMHMMDTKCTTSCWIEYLASCLSSHYKFKLAESHFIIFNAVISHHSARVLYFCLINRVYCECDASVDHPLSIYSATRLCRSGGFLAAEPTINWGIRNSEKLLITTVIRIPHRLYSAQGYGTCSGGSLANTIGSNGL